MYMHPFRSKYLFGLLSKRENKHKTTWKILPTSTTERRKFRLKGGNVNPGGFQKLIPLILKTNLLIFRKRVFHTSSTQYPNILPGTQISRNLLTEKLDRRVGIMEAAVHYSMSKPTIEMAL